MSDPVPVNNRKDLLLLVLAARDGAPIVGVTRLQKYLFLLQEKYEWDKRFQIDEPYEFRAYDYGPFDAQLYDDLDFFKNLGFIDAKPVGPEPATERDEQRGVADEWGVSEREVQPWEESSEVDKYFLTEKGLEFARRIDLPKDDLATVEAMKGEWNDRPLRDLLKWLYGAFPDYAKNTKLQHLQS